MSFKHYGDYKVVNLEQKLTDDIKFISEFYGVPKEIAVHLLNHKYINQGMTLSEMVDNEIVETIEPILKERQN